MDGLTVRVESETSCVRDEIKNQKTKMSIDNGALKCLHTY